MKDFYSFNNAKQNNFVCISTLLNLKVPNRLKVTTVFCILFIFQIQIFDANSSPDKAEITIDNTGILTEFLRIYPLNCQKGNLLHNHCLLRFEIFGC